MRRLDFHRDMRHPTVEPEPMDTKPDNQTTAAEDNSPEFGFNWQHYSEAFEICHEYEEKISKRKTETKRTSESELRVSPKDVKIPRENRLLPQPGYLCFYADLLGFSYGVKATGADALPDFYGGSLVAAMRHPAMKVYLLSDSCIAFGHVTEALDFVDCVTKVYASWLSNGMMPRCSIGYGSYVERKPGYRVSPSNFFGVQISGTALVDAMAMEKSNPLGSRILISGDAKRMLSDIIRIESDGQGNFEAFPERPMAHSVFDCVYYLLCSRSHDPNARPFKHYAWSIASRVAGSGRVVAKVALDLVNSKFGREDFIAIEREAGEAVLSYPASAAWAPQTDA